MLKTLLDIHQDLHVLIGKYLKTIQPQFITLNKPIYLGFRILEISEWEMYNFHYNSMVKKFNTRLLFTDTDSLCCELFEKNPYKKCKSKKNYFI